MAKKRVLLADDDPLFVRSTRAALHADVELHVVSTAADALAAIERLRPDLMLIDLLLCGADAFWLIDELRARARDAGVICLAKGPGAMSLTRLRSLGDGFFGVHRREAGSEALRQVVKDSLSDENGLVV